MPHEKQTKELASTVPIRLPRTFQKSLRAGVKKSGLSQQDLMRKSMEIGLPRLLRALEQAVSGEDAKATA